MRVSMRPCPSRRGLADEFVRRRGAEIVLDIGFQGRLVAFQGEQKIGLVGDDLVGDLDLAAHGVDGHQRARELPGLGEVVEKLRDGGDLVGLFRNAQLRQRQPGVGGVGAERMQGFQPLRWSWVRRAVLPSIAMNSCRSGQSAAIQLSKQRPNRIGSIRLTGRAASARRGCRDGTPKTAAKSRDGVCPTRRCRRSRRRTQWWRRSPAAGPPSADTSPARTRGRPRARKNAPKAGPVAPEGSPPAA